MTDDEGDEMELDVVGGRNWCICGLLDHVLVA